ncbi:hypothetical protein BMS3Bbin04_00080 [bacterium BMS3Bbin04]|nr:hypothetical protein BMS3Bbin04_00080 [bacterium BMS3Bbin04]
MMQSIIHIGTIEEIVLLKTAGLLDFECVIPCVFKKSEFFIQLFHKIDASESDHAKQDKNNEESQKNTQPDTNLGTTRKGVLRSISSIVNVADIFNFLLWLSSFHVCLPPFQAGSLKRSSPPVVCSSLR